VFPEVSKLNDNDIAIIKEVMKISIQNNNSEAMAKLAMKTKEAMGISSNMPPAQFLAVVVEDYTNYGFDK
jgi:hypothetical protein